MTPRARPLVLAIALTATLAARAGADESEGELGAAVQERLSGLRAEHGLPALGGLVIARGEVAGVAVVGSRALGDPAPVRLGDAWHLGSCTKAMTATLAAVLVERGGLRWDEPLAELLPDRAAAMHEGFRAVTLEQLLSHRAGVVADLTREPLWGRLFLDTKTPLAELRALLADALLGRAPDPPPGERFVYSNGGYVLAGMACERAGGAAWEELVRRELFGPLAMTGAGFGPPDAASTEGPGAPRGHRLDGERLVAIEPGPLADNPPAVAPAGTVHAPLRAWGAFARLHLRGARGEEGLLLAPATFRALHTARGEEGYALGWGAGERDWAGGRMLSHSGSNTMWFCTIVLAPDANAAALAVTNCGTPAAEKACAATVKALIALAREGR